MSSLYNTYTQTAANESQLTKMQDKLNGNLSEKDDEELMEVCKEFESYFIEKMYSAMLDTIPKDDKEENYASKMVDYFKDTAIKNISEMSTEQGGFGIAQTLYEQMKRQYNV